MSFSQTQHDEEDFEDDDEQEFEDEGADEAADLEEGLFRRIYARQGRRQAPKGPGASASGGGTAQPRAPDRHFEQRKHAKPGHARDSGAPSNAQVQERLL